MRLEFLSFWTLQGCREFYGYNQIWCVLSKFAKFARYQLTSHVAIARNWKEPLSRQLIYEENGQIKAHFLTEYPADPKKKHFYDRTFGRRHTCLTCSKYSWSDSLKSSAEQTNGKIPLAANERVIIQDCAPSICFSLLSQATLPRLIVHMDWEGFITCAHSTLSSKRRVKQREWITFADCCLVASSIIEMLFWSLPTIVPCRSGGFDFRKGRRAGQEKESQQGTDAGSVAAILKTSTINLRLTSKWPGHVSNTARRKVVPGEGDVKSFKELDLKSWMFIVAQTTDRAKYPQIRNICPEKKSTDKRRECIGWFWFFGQ